MGAACCAGEDTHADKGDYQRPIARKPIAVDRGNDRYKEEKEEEQVSPVKQDEEAK
jgi:hypothetical protein